MFPQIFTLGDPVREIRHKLQKHLFLHHLSVCQSWNIFVERGADLPLLDCCRFGLPVKHLILQGLNPNPLQVFTLSHIGFQPMKILCINRRTILEMFHWGGITIWCVTPKMPHKKWWIIYSFTNETVAKVKVWLLSVSRNQREFKEINQESFSSSRSLLKGELCFIRDG